MAETLHDALASGDADRLTTGFVFMEGPLWDPAGFWCYLEASASGQWRPAPGNSYPHCTKVHP